MTKLHMLVLIKLLHWSPSLLAIKCQQFMNLMWQVAAQSVMIRSLGSDNHMASAIPGILTLHLKVMVLDRFRGYMLNTHFHALEQVLRRCRRSADRITVAEKIKVNNEPAL